MNLVDFLLARIAEDEKLARDAIADDQGSDEGFANQYDALTSPPSGIGHAQGGFGKACARIIVTMTPRRILADVAAKRAIIADHAEFVEAIEYLSSALPGNLNQDPDAPWRTSPLRHLAAVYADHPDYPKD